MATPAQIAANRKNAEKSTGPRTEEGRARSSRNAVTHGLTSWLPQPHWEKQSEFTDLLADLRNEHRPVGATEDILVFKMAVAFFSSIRANALLVRAIERNEGEDVPEQVSLMLRYHTTSDRAFNKHLADLRKLQKEHRLEPAEPEEIGFVSQPAEATEATVATPENPPNPEPETGTTTATTPLKPLAEPPNIEKKAA